MINKIRTSENKRLMSWLYKHIKINEMRRDQLIMGYFDNLDDRSLKKYIKNLKNRKKFIDVFFYL
jgi:hypothetical protein